MMCSSNDVNDEHWSFCGDLGLGVVGAIEDMCPNLVDGGNPVDLTM